MSSNEENTAITVIIDTKNINIDNLETTVKFEDNRGGKEGAVDPLNSTDYYSIINKGKKVSWNGTVDPNSNDPGDSVLLMCVFANPINPGGALLKESAYIADSQGVITDAKVKSNPPKKNGKYVDENYYLVFMVKKTEPPSQNIYSIDPKLRILGG